MTFRILNNDLCAESKKLFWNIKQNSLENTCDDHFLALLPYLKKNSL